MKKCKLINIHDDEYLLALYAKILFSTWAFRDLEILIFISLLIYEIRL